MSSPRAGLIARLRDVWSEGRAVLGLARTQQDHGAALATHQTAIEQNRSAGDTLRAGLEGHDRRLDALESGLDALESGLAAHEAAIASHEAAIASHEAAIQGLSARIDRLDLLERSVGRIAACEAWVEAMPPSSTLISVVVPTRDRERSPLLERAVASVRMQTHTNWELFVVDDGAHEDTEPAIADVGDPRIRILQSDGKGAPAARNVGLDAATGEIVVYLDDDNIMFPLWLAGVAWLFDSHPGCDVAYGARVHQTLSDSLPEIEFEPFDAD